MILRCTHGPCHFVFDDVLHLSTYFCSPPIDLATCETFLGDARSLTVAGDYVF